MRLKELVLFALQLIFFPFQFLPFGGKLVGGL
jgi:hypothetical protein